MIELDATTIHGMIAIAWILSVVLGGCGGFGLRGLLMANKDVEPKKDDEHDSAICVHPTCQRRKTLNGWFNERLLIIGYNRLLKQQEKEMDMRVGEEEKPENGKSRRIKIGPIGDGIGSICGICTKRDICKGHESLGMGEKIIECNEYDDVRGKYKSEPPTHHNKTLQDSLETPYLCDRCVYKEICTAPIKGDLTKCDGFKDEAEKEKTKGNNVDEVV